MRSLEPGLTLRSWTLKERIGRGGHGDVWRATNHRGEHAALKIRPHTDDLESERFRREFERLRTLRLPGVIRVLGTGADQGYIYFVMELASGERLDRYLQKAKNNEERVRRAIDAGAGVAGILASIHQLQLAHRDIKPANVHVEPDPATKRLHVTLLDFGTHRFGSLRDDSGELLGTPAYMAPEQRLGMPHDHRADCYSLGVVLHEAISNTSSTDYPVGRTRPSLALTGPQIPLAVVDLVQRLLHLDPAARPAAAEAEAVLRSVSLGIPLAAAPWPQPISHTGDPTDLIEGNGVVVGPPGFGGPHLIREARWQWYRRGYPSLASQCAPDVAYGAWHRILDELFREQDPERRQYLAGDSAAVLRAIWPALPVPVKTPLQQRPGARDVAKSIQSVLSRSQPIAVVLWDLDRIDHGSAVVLHRLAQHSIDGVHIWATSTQPFSPLPSLDPPPWNADAAAATWRDLVTHLPPPEGLPPNPVAGLAAAWAGFAAERTLPPPPQQMPDALIRLSVLRQPFPRSVAVQIAPSLDELVHDGHLISLDPGAEGPQTRLSFANAATHELARLQRKDRAKAHKRALDAWLQEVTDPHVVRERAHHAFYSNAMNDDLLADLIETALEQGNALEVRRWLEVQEFYGGPATQDAAGEDFHHAYTRLYVDLMLHPGRVTRDRLRELAASAETVKHRGLAAYLKLKHATRGKDRARIAKEGRRWARSMAKGHPELAAKMLRETALVHLAEGQVSPALLDAEKALQLARTSAELVEDEITEVADDDVTAGRQHRLTQPEVDAAITYSATLVYSGALKKAATLSKNMAHRCQRAGRARGEASFRINQAIALLRLGDRTLASECVAEARALHHHHLDPDLIGNWATVAARLATERGDLAAGARLLDEAITAGQATKNTGVLAEAWAISLDAAAQSGSAKEAQLALATYGSEGLWSPRDHWPAALGRWHWATGDLDGALAATQTERIGFGGACVEAERARLLLVSGQISESIRTAREALKRPDSPQREDLHMFLRLVLGAAESHHDGDYVPLVSQTRQRQWVHLYLGALHLDAIRRRRRGENVSAVLRQLEDRSADVGHALYRALARSSGW